MQNYWAASDYTRRRVKKEFSRDLRPLGSLGCSAELHGG